MNAIDRAILEHCTDAFRPLKPLREHIPQGTLYRHTHRLLDVGELERESGLYRTTEVGRRHLLEAQLERRWDRLEQIYLPLRLIPTPVHRAFVELMLAAVIARQHPYRDDRHPVFVAVGRTLRWKTSLGLFMCYALGLDPALVCIECASETGKSLFVRRSGRGQIIFTRAVLESSFLLLDEFLDSVPSIRATLKVFLRGRRTVPLDNQTLTIRPVPLLTLNPRAAETLEERLGLSAPEIRRAIVVNLDAVTMPDLAAMGEQALAEAKAHGPITLTPPATDCAKYLTAIVQLVRALLVDEAQERLDVHVVVNLCTGMTALLPEPTQAIAQVIHGIGLLAETMGWARPGWIQTLADFSLEPRPRASSLSSEEAGGATSVVATHQEPRPVSPKLSFQLSRIPKEQHAAVPAVSQMVRDRMTWLAVETGRSVDETYGMLIDLYLLHRKDSMTIPILRRILVLAHQLEVAELDVDEVRGYLGLRAWLEQHGCDFHDIPEALRLIDCLSALPQSWRWAEVKYVVRVMAIMMREGISAKEVEEFIVRHRRLDQLGFDEATSMAVAKALKEAGAVGQRRTAVIDRLVNLAHQKVEVGELEVVRRELQSEVQGGKATIKNLNQAITDAEQRLRNVQRETAEVAQHLEQLSEEYERKSAHRDFLEGFEHFVLGKLNAEDPFWNELERLLEKRRKGEVSAEQAKESLLGSLGPKFLEFVTQLAAQAPGGGAVLH